MKINLNDEKSLKKLGLFGVDVIPKDRKYWFIRTNNGEYYSEFLEGNYVAIEWDLISDVQNLKEIGEDELKQQVKERYPDIKQPGRVSSKIYKFINHISKDDIVLIPSKSSDYLSIGVFVDKDAYREEKPDNFIEQFHENSDTPKEFMHKRRRVKWIKTIKKEEVDPYLYSIIFNHSAIAEITKEAIYIDRTLSDFYVKGDEASFTLKVNRESNIPYRKITKLLYYGNRIIDYAGESIGLSEEELDNLVLKINVQSKYIQLKDVTKTVIPIGITMMFLFGGSVEIMGTKFETMGLPALIKVLKDKNDNVDIEDESDIDDESNHDTLDISKILEDIFKAQEEKEIRENYDELRELIKELEVEVPNKTTP